MTKCEMSSESDFLCFLQHVHCPSSAPSRCQRLCILQTIVFLSIPDDLHQSYMTPVHMTSYERPHRAPTKA
ncbi:hypothetical protein DPEC_G00178710 [Dallia pectoralis]|uniref:Uncharacterized protein n=1 Tax=Dallia pectoralis TaxID=75939 RepID=A0ACC2GF77_DALPE|nr:hypothetical protein DPEC_G00178710 [Dallia pectoralis]